MAECHRRNSKPITTIYCRFMSSCASVVCGAVVFRTVLVRQTVDGVGNVSTELWEQVSIDNSEKNNHDDEDGSVSKYWILARRMK